VAKRDSQFLLCDVHPEHRYSDMSIPVNGKKVSIKTYKHDLREIRRNAASLPLELLRLQEYHLKDLSWKPPREGFENIYDQPERPIFYICQLRKR